MALAERSGMWFTAALDQTGNALIEQKLSDGASSDHLISVVSRFESTSATLKRPGL
jgi:hypothetical protein